MTRQPPRAAVRLLRACLGDRAFDAVAGDLDEEFAAGRSSAWYWMFAIRSIGANALASLPSLGETLAASMRQLRRRPTYAAAITGTLALAVATATASAVVVKRAFVDPLPYPHAERLVSILTSVDGATSSVAAGVYEDLKAGSPPFDLLAPTRPLMPALRTSESTVQVNGLQVTPEYFSMLGAHPQLGHVWSLATEPVVVVSWRFFTGTLGSDPAAVGRAIVLGDVSRTVIGVLPENFFPPHWPNTDVWLPLDIATFRTEPRGRRQFTLLARRAEGIEPGGEQTFLSVFSQRQRTEQPVVHGRQSWVTVSLIDELTGAARPALMGLSVGALMLLLIVCANIGGLSAAHALGQQQQLAIRQAMGASRRRLIGEQLADSVVLAAVGTTIGLALTPLLVGLAGQYQREFLDRLPAFALDSVTLTIGLAAGLVTGIAAAFIPARLLEPARLDAMLRAARGATGNRRLTLTRQLLIVTQVAFALVLLIGAGLLSRTVQHLTRLSPGFKTEGMVSVAVSLPGTRFASQAQQIQFEEVMLERFRQLPGVVSATASIGLAATPAMGASLHIEGRSTAEGLSEVGYTSIAPGLIDQLALPIESGRDIATTDSQGTTGAILINRTMERQFWPEGGAIGARIYLGPGRPEPGDWMSVVGVVGDTRASLLAPAIRPTAYGSTRQYSWPRRHFTLYAPSAPPTLPADIRAAVRAVDPAVTLGAIQQLPDVFATQRARHRLVLTVLVVYAAVSLALCATGLYAIVALTSRQRRREYAIRLALGASPFDVRWRVVRHAMTLALAGIVLGAGIASLGVRTIEGLLHGVTPGDLRTYASAAVVLGLLASIAAWWPARQAARVSPTESLQDQG